LKYHLVTLRNSIPGLRGVLLAFNEGLPVAHSTFPMEPIRTGSRRWRPQPKVWDAGSVKAWLLADCWTYVSVDDGVLFIYSAGLKAVPAVTGPMGSNAGPIHLEARGIANEIGDLF
jgi:predicted regulator of Ras-like GTPase activity (Roadblock/LC7/MglB family)